MAEVNLEVLPAPDQCTPSRAKGIMIIVKSSTTPFLLLPHSFVGREEREKNSLFLPNPLPEYKQSWRGSNTNLGKNVSLTDTGKELSRYPRRESQDKVCPKSYKTHSKLFVPLSLSLSRRPR